MVTAVGFVPSAPLLIPDLAGGAAERDEPLRGACLDVIRCIGKAGSTICVVAPAVTTAGEWPSDATWDFTGFGVARRPEPNGGVLPWPLGIGAWLLDAAGWEGRRRYVAVDATTTVAYDDADVAVLAVADGGACRTEKAPGYLDARAEGFDQAIMVAIDTGDAEALAAIDPGLAAELWCTGWPVWRQVAMATVGRRVAEARLLASAADYGVGYFAGYWLFS